MLSTVWKLLKLSVIQILREIKVGQCRVSKSAILTHWDALKFDFLREINFGDCRSSKTADFVILGALNFVNLANFSLQKVEKFINMEIFRAPKCGKMADFDTLHSPTLISRKI